jgi:hypothetical protein
MTQLQHIYKFLLENREHNDKLQRYELQKAMFGAFNAREYTLSLLYYAYNTQTQPKLDNALTFFERIVKHGNFESMCDFTHSLEQEANLPKSTNASYLAMYTALAQQAGWGPKTAALFVKSVYNLHTKWQGQLGFWLDAPQTLAPEDKLMLPVDAVILYIFNHNVVEGKNNWDFATINERLAKEQNTDMEVWDDLWFWGFITQVGSGTERNQVYNKAKLWSLYVFTNDKDYRYSLIEEKTEEFTQILTNPYL